MEINKTKLHLNFACDGYFCFSGFSLYAQALNVSLKDDSNDSPQSMCKFQVGLSLFTVKKDKPG